MKAGVQKLVELESHHITDLLLEAWSLSIDLLGFPSNTSDELKAFNLTICDSRRSDFLCFMDIPIPLLKWCCIFFKVGLEYVTLKSIFLDLKIGFAAQPL